eukprot:scaffold3726_cov270-Pinguiococcus_pyrenoidosus.AAC.14
MPYSEKPVSRVGSRNFSEGRRDYEDEYSEKASKAQLYEEKQMELSTAMSQQLRKLFHTFCARGASNMDSARFLKLLRDCKIIGEAEADEAKAAHHGPTPFRPNPTKSD